MAEKNNKGGWVLPVLVTVIGGFMSVLDSSIVNVAISAIMHAFDVDTSQIEWVITIYMLAMASVIPLCAWAGDKFGEKALFIFSISVFTLGSFFCAISWSLSVLIVARVLQALGGGFLMPLMMTMCKKIVPKENFASAMGFIGVAMLLAPALGPTIGGFLVDYFNWRWIFTINIPIGIIGVLLSIFFLPKLPARECGKLDIGGALTAIAMLFSLLLALSKGAVWGWTSESTILLFYLSFCSLILFLYIELTAKKPLLNLRVFQSRTFTLANLIIVVSNIGLYSVLYFVPLFIQNIKGLGAFQTGLIMLPGALISGMMMPIIGKLYTKYGPRPLTLFGLIVLAITTFQFHYLDTNTSNNLILLWLVFRGVGMSFAMMPAQTSALDSVKPEFAGSASAITNIISRIGGSFGIAVLTCILSSRETFHATITGWKISANNPAVSDLLQKFSSLLGANDSATAYAAGGSALKELVAGAAFVQSLDDIFIISSIIIIVGLIPTLFLNPGKNSSGEQAFIE